MRASSRWVLARLLLLLCGCFVGASASPHLPQAYTLREWHEQDGLPSEELTAVLQDSAGFLWVAYRGGMARFDGTHFEPAAVPAGGFTGGLALAPDHAALLLLPGIGTHDTAEAGLYRLKEGQFRFEAEPALAGRDPRTLHFASDGSLWIGCEDGTVLWRRGQERQLFEPPPNLSGRRRATFASDQHGQVWVLRGDRLSRVDHDRWIDVPIDAPGPELRIASSALGGIWVFTRTALSRWTGSSLEEVVSLPELQGAHFVLSAIEDRQGVLWVGTRSQGLFRINGRETLPVPVSSNEVTALCEDTTGNLWATTDGGGLSRLRPKAHELLDRQSGLKEDISYTVAEDTSGVLWLANRDGGMARIIGTTVDPISQRANWRTFSARSVYPSPDGMIWMTTGVGIFRTRASAPEQLERVSALTDWRGARTSFVSRAGDYWLAADPDQLVRWSNGQLTRFGPSEGYDGRELRAFAEDESGRVWLGAADGKLFRSAEYGFERVIFARSDDCGAIQVVRFERDGTMLLGTTRRGVVVAPQGDFSRSFFLDRDRGLFDNNVSQILADDHDRVWFASRRGIFWVHGAELRDFILGRAPDVHAVQLGKDDGLPHLACQGLFQPAAWKASDGTLWFATRRGMLRTDPSLVGSQGEGPPAVTIADVRCDDRSVPTVTRLEILSTVRKIELRLSALNLTSPESVQIRTRLDGFDSEWVVQSKDRMVSYPRLPPGNYVFGAMSSNGSGAWSEQPELLTILVRPPWYQSDWAFVGYALLMVGAISVVVRKWSHRRLRLRLEHSERARSIEQERSRIARNIHDDVGASLTRISLLTQAAQQESGRESAVLEKIHETARSITRSMDEIVWAVNPRHDNSESLLYYTSNYARSFLETAGIRYRFESPPDLPEVMLTSQTRHHLYLSCKEALHNVVKHADATQVSIRARVESDHLTISIADDGRGLAAASGEAGTPTAGPGNGLRNMRHRLAEIGGVCTIETAPGSGTTVHLTVPLPPDALRPLLSAEPPATGASSQ